MIKIGITGSIGSGKSYICKLFNEKYNIPIFNSDKEASEASENDIRIIKKYKKMFGDDIYIDGKLNRKKLADIIFNDKSTLNIINNLFKPILLQKFNDWCDKQNSKIVIIESAIIFETGFNKHVDKTISVISPLDLRLLRVVTRDGTTIEKVKERINNQMSDEERIKLSDWVINNDGENLNCQIEKIINDLCKE